MTNLQRNIHPLAMKNLRSLLDFNEGDWSKLINDIKNTEMPKTESSKIDEKKVSITTNIDELSKSPPQDNT